MVDNKAPIKSYKDKYLKMKFKFDRKMHESEELHKLEQKAIDTARRLAIQNEYVPCVHLLPSTPTNTCSVVFSISS